MKNGKMLERQFRVLERPWIISSPKFSLDHLLVQGMKLNVLVVDDQKEEVEQLLISLKENDRIHSVEYCQSSDDAMNILENEHIHLMFLDVKLGNGLSGMDLANIAPSETLKVFVSNYPEFGADAFGINEVLHFLRKPVNPEDLMVAIDRACHHFTVRNRLIQSKNFCFVRTDKTYRKVSYADIIMIEGYHEHTKIYLEREQIITLVGMKPLLEQIKSDRFIRTHRSYAVNVDHIVKLDNTSIWVTSNYEVPIGRTYREFVLDALLNGNVIERYGNGNS